MHHCNVSVENVTLIPWRRERRLYVGDWRIGNSPERLIYFSMPCSMGINRQQVQHILESVTLTAQLWYSNCGDGTWRIRSLLQGTRVGRDVAIQSVTFNVTSMTDELRISTKAPMMLPLLVPCLMIPLMLIRAENWTVFIQRRSVTAVPAQPTQQDLDNSGKVCPSHWKGTSSTGRF